MESELLEIRNNISMIFYKTMNCFRFGDNRIRYDPYVGPISNEEKMKLLDLDIAIIEKRLKSFTWRSEQAMYFYAKELFYSNDREYIKCMINVPKDLSDLDYFWNSQYVVTEELNRQINELNNSNAGLCHMNQKVADLYSIYTEVKQRLQTMMLKFEQKLEWTKSEHDSMNWNKSFDNGSDGENQKSGCFGSDFESFRSDLSSKRNSKCCINDDKSDGCGSPIKPDMSEEYLTNWIISVGENQKSGCFGSDSESVVSDSKRVAPDSEVIRSDLCSERSSTFFIVDDKSDGLETLFNTDIVDTEVAAEETIVETPLDNDAHLWRVKWIIIVLQWIIVFILSSVGWLEPRSRGTQNNFKWPLELGLRYMNATERD